MRRHIRPGRVPRTRASSIKGGKPNEAQSSSNDQQATTETLPAVQNNSTLSVSLSITTMASTSSRVFHQYSVAFAWILIAVFVSCASAQFSGPIGPPDQYDEPEPPIEGFHFKLSEDILVNATKRAVLNDYNILDLGKNNELSVVAVSSGLDKVSGIFRPSNGYYFLSTLVHVAVVAEEETAEDSTSNSEKEPRVTVSICINANCGNSA